MGLISQSTLDAVNDLSIVDVIEHYNIKLQRKGKNFMCCCPFHSEKTPSFSVSTRLNIARCFSCNKGGGPVQFVMQYEGLSYRDAVIKLAQDHNIQIEYDAEERSEEQISQDRHKQSLKAALEVAQQFFAEQLLADSEEASKARQYAFERWGEEFCRLAGIGYAPKSSAVFLNYIRESGYELEPFIELGLVRKNDEKGTLYALLRQRVTLPVRDRYKAVVSFSARYIGDNEDIQKSSKYMNLSDSLVFRKNQTIFGIDVALRAAQESKNFVVVEGGPDVLRLQIIGVRQAVATMGTALSTYHLQQLKKTAGSLCFIPDSDAPKGKLYGAGTEAVMRNGKLALEMGFDVSVKEIPRTEKDDEDNVKYDADSYITSKEVYNKIETTPFIIWYTKKRLQGADTSQLQSEVIDEAAALMVAISDQFLKETYIEQLAKVVGKVKIWRDAIKRASRKVKEEENQKADYEGLSQKVITSLRRVGIVPRNGCYYAPDDDDNLVRCSNFWFDPVLHIKNKQKSTRIFKLVNINGDEDVVEFSSSDLVTVRDFNKKLFDRGNFIWRGDAKTLLAIQEHLLEVTPSASLIEILGYDPVENHYAFSNGLYADGEFLPTDGLGVVGTGTKNFFLPAFSKIHQDNELGYSFERLFRCNSTGATSFYDFSTQLVKVFGTGGMVGIAWTLAAIFRDIIFEKLKYFPVLNLFGRKGSGKTELARALSSLFYILPATPNSCSNTSIPVIGYNLSHVRNAVYILDEYTNDLMPQRIDLLKGLWGGTARSKMEDGIPITIPVSSGVILAGQYRPEDEAIFSRCIHLMYSKTAFTREEKKSFNALADMVRHGNTHLLLPILDLRDIFEKGYFQAFDMTLNDVMAKLEKEVIEDRILNNWVVALSAFRVLEPHLQMPFKYPELLEVVVNGIRYQNEQISKSSDTANFWLYIDAMHTQGKVKEKCHFVIKLLNSFTAIKKDRQEFVNPKRVLFLNFKAVRGILEQRLARQKSGSTLDTATLESYLKSLPQFLGLKQQRFQMLRNNGELDEVFKTEGAVTTKYIYGNPSQALCFDYDSLKHNLDLNLETFRMSEQDFDSDLEDESLPEEKPQEQKEDTQGKFPF